MGTDDLIAELAELTAAERMRIRLALEVLDCKKPDDNADLLWRELVEEASERGIHFPLVIRRSKRYGQFRKDAEWVVEYMRERVRPNDKTELVQAVRLGARALLSRMMSLRDNIGLEITSSVVMGQVQNLPAAVEMQWPGGGEELRFLLMTEGKQ